MKLTIPELIRRLEVAAVQAQDLNMEVLLDGIYYLHANSMHGHRLELVDVQAVDQRRDAINELRLENARLRAELEQYKQAYG